MCRFLFSSTQPRTCSSSRGQTRPRNRTRSSAVKASRHRRRWRSFSSKWRVSRWCRNRLTTATKLRPDPSIRTKDYDSLRHTACEETIDLSTSVLFIANAFRRHTAPQYLSSCQLLSSQRCQTIVPPHTVQILVRRSSAVLATESI